ncbi:MAG: hypothetical protein QOK29_3525, partial [Rhodospirillaceae bacterium]|nr:hypothetical protein [Rhodospirillaceae bacterium]
KGTVDVTWLILYDNSGAQGWNDVY